MRLKRFEVRNYKNFKDTFVMDFSKVGTYNFNKECLCDGLIKNAIIYGKNAVGKSNFGRAVLDITNHLVDKAKDFRSSIAYTNADEDSKEAWFRYTFVDDKDEIVYEYKKTSSVQVVFESLEVNQELVFSYDYQKNIGDFDNFKKYGLSTLNWRFLEEGISFLRYMANNLTLDDEHPVMKLMCFVEGMLWFCSLGNGNEYIGFSLRIESISEYIIRNGYVHELEAFLRNHDVNEHLEAVTEINGQRNLYFKHTKGYVPFSSASSGTNALLAFYYWYKQLRKATFVFIDEFDAFYHFELSEQLVRLSIHQLDMQVILTSHNTNLLTNRILRPDCCFILTKDRLSSFSEATARRLKEENNLERLYMGGEFDG